MNNRILIIDIDSKIPNLALKKIEKYHKNRGDIITWNKRPYKTDKIYVSCILTENKENCKKWLKKEANIGGSGWSLKKTLPPEIEKVRPRINLGFTTRGCIRNCPFCIVPKKEGNLKAIGDIYDIWDGKSKNLVLLDNNILGLPEHFKKICYQLRKEKIKVDFNQGLDCRLLNDEIVKELKSISHIEYRFAFDSMEVEIPVLKAIKLLKKYKINRSIWYVLVGFNTTFKQDLYRLKLLKNLNQNAYVMRYNKTKNRIYIPLAKWANQPHIFRGMTWEKFICHPSNERYKLLLQEKGLLEL